MLDQIIYYDDFVAGDYKRHRRGVNLSAMMPGARFTTNDFGDRSLQVHDSIFRNLLEIIQSGRRQGFERLDICFRTFPVEGFNVDLLMALGRVFITKTIEEYKYATHQEYFRKNGLPESEFLVIYFPDNMWKEAICWGAIKLRDSKNGRIATDEDLSRLEEMYQFNEMSTEDIEFVMGLFRIDK